MLVTTLQALLGLALLYAGGEGLVRGAAGLALRMGIAPIAVGLSIVAFGTSAPELTVSFKAALDGIDDVAVGNVVGSNIGNVGLILGLSALVRPIQIHAQFIRLDMPIMIAASLLLCAVLADGRISRLEGCFLVAGLLVYTGFNLWQARREDEPVQEELALMARRGAFRVLNEIVFITGGLAALILGGSLFVRAAVLVAEQIGISNAVIGLTVVAIGTSLPELATSVVASLRQKGDIAVGNVIGSNVFNVMAVLGITAAVRPVTRGGVDWSDLAVMVGFAILMLGLIFTGRRLTRVEGVALIGLYGCYLWWRLAR